MHTSQIGLWASEIGAQVDVLAFGDTGANLGRWGGRLGVGGISSSIFWSCLPCCTQVMVSIPRIIRAHARTNIACHVRTSHCIRLHAIAPPPFQTPMLIVVELKTMFARGWARRWARQPGNPNDKIHDFRMSGVCAGYAVHKVVPNPDGEVQVYVAVQHSTS